MKTAEQYARQALRFAERAMVEHDATAIKHEWQVAYDVGQLASRRNNASDASRESSASTTVLYAKRAARAARRAREGGWWAESWRVHACESAKHAAWCAGYAAA